MTAVSLQQLDGPRQLWLDVARPIQPRPRRARDNAGGEAGGETQPPSPSPLPPQGQFELRMTPAPVEAPARTAFQIRAAVDRSGPAYAGQPRPFAAWLMNQTRQPGTLGELAKATRLDRSFPKSGTADDVRAHFSAAGADGDAFEALDDAERAFDRQRLGA
jgi:hypothetical protein